MSLPQQGCKCSAKSSFDVFYNGQLLGTKRVDLVIDGCLVELKAKKSLDELDAAQVLSYLKASGYPLALLINFGNVRVQSKRFANTLERGQVTAQKNSAPHSLQRLSDSGNEEPQCQR